MNTPMIKRLVAKDWYFNRWAITAYTLGGMVAVGLIGYGSKGTFYAGSVLLITAMITIGIHLVMTTVETERSEQTLAFVMSLPISPKDYTIAKILANMVIFLLAWGVLVVATIAAIAGRTAIPDGLIPYGIAVLMQILGSYVLMLCVAIVFESIGWTIAAIVIGNLLMQAVMYSLGGDEATQKMRETDVIVWTQPIVNLLWIEVVAIVAMLALTFHLQGRKTEFV